MTKLLIIGSARHGKDTACEIFQKHGFAFVSASKIAAEHIILPAIGENYEGIEDCYADRVNRRSEWFDLIAEYNRDDPAKLAKLVLSQSDIYCGIRARVEFDAAKSLFDHIIWIDRSNELPREDSSSFELYASDANHIINNNRNLWFLNKQIKELIQGWSK